MTIENEGDGLRCGNPVISGQWGLKFNGTEMWGLTMSTFEATGKTLAGVGFWTVDGFLHQGSNKTERLWYKDICEMNGYYNITCNGECCP